MTCGTCGTCGRHQDSGYQFEHCDPFLTVTAWVPLVDADESNGCMWVLPWRLEDGILPHHSGIVRDGVASAGAPVFVLPTPSSLSLFLSLSLSLSCCRHSPPPFQCTTRPTDARDGAMTSTCPGHSLLGLRETPQTKHTRHHFCTHCTFRAGAGVH